MKQKNTQILSEFVLKLIAILAMTLDHVGLAMAAEEGSPLYLLGLSFRVIGRLAFPLFAFMLAEGMRHTHCRPAYLLRLAGDWFLVFIVDLILVYGFHYFVAEQAFTDLLCCALFIFLLEQKKKTLRLLALLPLAFICFSYYVEIARHFTIAYDGISYLLCGYSLMGFLMFLGFYYAPKLASGALTRFWLLGDIPLGEYQKTPSYQRLVNLMGCLFFLLSVLIFYGVSYIGKGNDSIGPYDAYNMSIQSYCLLAIVLIACYSGKRGYNAKWFQYGSYAYYPLHLAIIYGIKFLIEGLGG